MSMKEVTAEIELLAAQRDFSGLLAFASKMEAHVPQDIAPAMRALIARAAVQIYDLPRARRETDLYEAGLGTTLTGEILRADIAFAEGRTREAATAFTELARRRPDNDYCWSRAYHALNRADPTDEEMIAFLDLWGRLGPDKIQPRLMLAHLHGRSGRKAEAADIFLELEPQRPLSAHEYLLADSLMAERDPQARLDLLQRGVWRHPQSPALRERYAKVLLRAGREAAADPQTEEQVALQGERQLVGSAFLSAGPFVGGLTDPVLEQAVSAAGLGGAEPQRLVQVARALLLPLRRLGMVLRGAERETPALYPYGAANSAHASAGVETLCTAAAAVLRRALELDIHTREAYAVLAEVLLQLGDAPGAVRARRAYIQEGDATPESWRQLAIDCIAAGDREGAIAAAARAYGADPVALDYLPFQPFEAWSADWADGSQRLAAGEARQVSWTAVLDEAVVEVALTATDPPLDLQAARDVAMRSDRLLVNGRGEALGNDHLDVSPLSNPQLAVHDLGVVPRPAETEPTVIGSEPIFAGHQPFHFNQYFHATAQNFVRLALVADAVPEAPLLIPHDTPGWSRDMLGRLGFGAERLAEMPESALFTLPRARLIAPCKMSDATARAPVAAFRERVARIRLKAGQAGRRLFLTRAGAAYVNRTLVNEAELVALAEGQGFEALDPGALSIDEQIDLFGQAEAICGATGAAFTNMLFMPQGARAICFSPRETCRNYFPLLACAAGLSFTWCLGHMAPAGLRSRNFPHVPYFVEPATFRRALERVG